MRVCISKAAAVGACALLCAIYVGVLYAFAPNARLRDDPMVMRRRIGRTLGVCALAPLALVACHLPMHVPERCAHDIDVSLHVWLGLRLGVGCLLATLAAIALTCTLYLGPLVMMRRADWEALRSERLTLELANVRTLVVGPLAEEVVFRSVMCPLLHGAGFSDAGTVWLAALTFGCAHLHHKLDLHADWSAVGLMFGYTTLFGAYSAYLFARTGYLLPPLCAHVLCNLLGLPDFGAIEYQPRPRLVAGCFALGIFGFAALTTGDALLRPPLFGSVLWHEYRRG